MPKKLGDMQEMMAQEGFILAEKAFFTADLILFVEKKRGYNGCYNVCSLREGKRLLPENYEDIKYHLNSTGAILELRNRGFFGLFSVTDNKFLLPVKYGKIEVLNNYLFAVMRKENKKWGVYSTADGKFVVDFEHDRIGIEGSSTGKVLAYTKLQTLADLNRNKG